ncbi:MAG: 2-oxoglutarate dehydrogenase complex dihydrolipoyllysine-residue succinyltransferase [Deltaproteobacteria bacterium]|nr:2-oxoglutarate dehydrogenase complex dihydrolipoyllysine-residue succinyltransferase [Deltaproteobacteria bacterium]
MMIEVKVPSVGESVSEGVLLQWFKAGGEVVRQDEPLFELETDKITMQVQAERGGRLNVEVAAGATVTIGQVVGRIDTSVAVPEAAEPQAETADRPPTAPPAVVAPRPRDPVTAPAVVGTPAAPVRLAPSLRRLVRQHALDPQTLVASIPGGRVTRTEVEAAASGAPSGAGASQSGGAAVGAPRPREAVGADGEPRETRRPMTSLRRRLAERLVQAQHDAAMLTTFNEADLSALLALRARYQEEFSRRNGIKLGLMSFFVKAVVEALRSVPALNARLEGDELVQNHYYDLGVAVSTERGLVVPVVRGADRLTFAEVERTIAELAERARSRRLELPELLGGCFTISNGGVYGSLLSTPILNPPQCGILGMHAIKKRPVVVADELAVRPMMYLALSYDHRIVDGEQAVTFLRRVVECVEAPERLMLEV